MNSFFSYKKRAQKEAGITTTSEGENESLLSFFLNAVGATLARSLPKKSRALLQQMRRLTRACMHQLRMPLEQTRPQAGFTILLAVIVVSVVVLLGATIASIYEREARLRATSRASSVAFYNADSAMECAMFYDRNQNSFSTSSPSMGNVECSGVDATGMSTSQSGGVYLRSFQLNPNSDDICAGVTVRKDTTGERTITTIESRGRDTCVDSERQAERALITAY